jgi:glucose/arabinose dehydrogenase
VFDREGHLFLTLGERGQRALAQRLDRHQGKIVRLRPDGRVPPDNPFVSSRAALPELWSRGHRNVQGAALHPDSGELWTHEHGPMGGDEINIARAGRNYGWPLATHGLDYSGEPIPEARGPDAPGTEAPIHVWSRSPGVSGMAFCVADGCGPWRGHLFVGALGHRALLRLELDGERVRHEERLLEPLRERIRDIEAAPDGSLYLLTDAARGRLLRVQIFPGS